MTETVSGSAVRKGRRKSQGGLKVRRIHTRRACTRTTRSRGSAAMS